MNCRKLKKLENALRGIETPEKGFYTRYQWSVFWKVSEQHTSRQLKKLVENNMMKIKYFRIKSGQLTRLIPHYKML